MDNDFPLVDNEDFKKIHSLIESQEKMFDIMGKMKKDNTVSLEMTIIEPN